MSQSNETAPINGSLGGCGARLQKARQASGLSQEDVATRLKMPLHVVRALETGDPSSLGAPVFVRGQLRSYARLLGINIEDQLDQAGIGAVAPSVLVSHSHTPPVTRFAQQATRRLIYIAITAAIAVPIWFSAQPHLSGKGDNQAVQSLEIPATTTHTTQTATPPAPKAQPVQRTPVVASIASMPAAHAAPAAALSFNFTGDNWVEIYAADGRLVEKGLLTAGDRRSYAIGEVSRVKLGNISSVEVLQGGKPVDLAPFSRANVARFTLSSDGSLAPVAD